ncbi:MAG: hypothetical protein KJ906_00260 [Nanoarchaeota archaeon]|nr:hypothetical protein [Nanoarchaeota archaeon]
MIKVNASNKGLAEGTGILMIVLAVFVLVVVLTFMAIQSGFLTAIGSKISNLITFKIPF